MCNFVMRNKKPIAFMLVGSLALSAVGSERAAGHVRLMSREESSQVTGGWFYAAWKAVEVVGVLCTIASAGWLVVQETYGSSTTPGCDKCQTRDYASKIRREIKNNGTSCSLTNEYDKVVEIDVVQ